MFGMQLIVDLDVRGISTDTYPEFLKIVYKTYGHFVEI
jgi:hypothetical protein